jgi:orotidine-5'-phosphate decarboxylase
VRALARLEARAARGSRLCVGLDPDPAMLPEGLRSREDGLQRFLLEIVAATSEQVLAYKPNMAFFEALGMPGYRLLEVVLQAIPADIPVILDAKRGDIGNTARMYAQAAFEVWGCDAVTVSPYMGRDTIQPFVDFADGMTFVLAATSNAGAGELQDLAGADGVPVYRRVARMAAALHGRPGAVGLVAGATQGQKLQEIRQAAPDLWMLVPGVGAQGGDLALAVRGAGARGIINVSRSVLYASRGMDYAEAASRKAKEMNDAIRQCASGV